MPAFPRQRQNHGPSDHLHPKAPAAIGPYSQAVKVGNQVFLSGQIGLDPVTMEMVEGVEAQARRVFDNLAAVAEAAGGSFADVVKITIYLTDPPPTSAWSTRSAKSLLRRAYPGVPPSACGAARGALVEADLVLVLG